PLQMHTPTVDVGDPFQPSREMNNAVRRDDFTRARESTKTCRNVERRSAEASVDLDRLARVNADADIQRSAGIGTSLLLKAHLESNGRAKGLASRGEDG